MAVSGLRLPDDKELLAFVFARFVDGEFTGLKEGKALNYAPDLEAADFLARQIRDEIRHARMYRTLYEYCAVSARVPHSPWLLTQIMAPVTGRLWVEHCFLDKAVGERWVLHLMEAIIQNTADRKIINNLKAIAKDEMTHIRFGEEQTLRYAATPFMRYYLWGLYLRVDLSLALAYRLTRSLIGRKYSPAAQKILTVFFTQTRTTIAAEIAALLSVKPARSLLQLLICQLIFWLRLPFVGWWRSPRTTF